MSRLCGWQGDGWQRAGWDPGYEPKRGMVAASEVVAGNLQVTTIDVALVERYAAVDGHFLIRAAAHGVVCTLDHGVAITVGEGDRAFFGVVDG